MGAHPKGPQGLLAGPPQAAAPPHPNTLKGAAGPQAQGTYRDKGERGTGGEQPPASSSTHS